MKKVLTTSKKFTALMLALLVCAASFAVAVSAELTVLVPSSVDSVRTDTRLYVTVAASGYDFTCSAEELDEAALKDATWTDGGTNAVCSAQFDNLKPATPYFVYSRVLDGKDYVYSDAAVISTKHSAPKKPVAGTDFKLESVGGTTDLKLTNLYNKAGADPKEEFVLQYSYDGETYVVAAAGENTLNNSYKQGTEYTVYFRFYPAENAGEYMSGEVASAKATTWTLPRIEAPNFTNANVLYVSDTEIRVTNITSEAQEVVYTITPTAERNDSDDIIFFLNLTPGTTYTISAVAVSVDPEHYNDSNPSKVVVKTKTAPGAAPLAPVPEKITNNSITVKTVAGVEFSKDNINWQASGTFTGLSNSENDGKYTIYARYAETADAMPSKTSKIGINLVKDPYPETPKKPVLISYSNTEIVVKMADDEIAGRTCEFSIDDGKTWNKTGKFEGLIASKTYNVIARYAVGATDRLPGKTSAALQVTTAKRANYKAEITKCTVVWGATEVEEGTMISFTATGDELANPIPGDTRYVPVNWYFDSDKDNVIKVNKGEKNSYNGYIPAETRVGKYSVKVNFAYEVYQMNGDKGEWVPVKDKDGKAIVLSQAQQIIVNEAPTWYETILSYLAIAFSYIGEFLLETIPGFILGLIG